MTRVLLIPSCKDPARTLKRLQIGLREWNKGKYDIMVLSGTANDRLADKTDMLEWLLEQPFRPDIGKVIREKKSRNTYENVYWTLWELNDRNYDSIEISVVTQWQHGYRFKKSFGARQIKVLVIRTGFQLSKFQYLKEWMHMIAHWVYPMGGSFVQSKK